MWLPTIFQTCLTIGVWVSALACVAFVKCISCSKIHSRPKDKLYSVLDSVGAGERKTEVTGRLLESILLKVKHAVSL
jgi:hypothetical protein